MKQKTPISKLIEWMDANISKFLSPSEIKAKALELDAEEQKSEYCNHTPKEREVFGERTRWTCLGCNKPINYGGGDEKI